MPVTVSMNCIESPSNPHGLGVLGSGQFYGQKGGSLASCGAELQFNGDWGFTMLSGSGHPNQWSYPDFPAVMNIARAPTGELEICSPSSGCRHSAKSSVGIQGWDDHLSAWWQKRSISESTQQ